MLDLKAIGARCSVRRAAGSRALAFAIPLLLMGCGRPADTGSSEAEAPDSVVAGQPDVLRSDTLRALLDRLAVIFAPVESWRDRALAEMRADSGSAKADTLFLRLRLEGKEGVRRTGKAFYDRELQAALYPDGAWGNVLRRERLGLRAEADPVSLARADTLDEWLRRQWLWTSRGEGDFYVDLDEQVLLDSLGRFVGPDIRASLRIWTLDQREPFAGDASLLAPPDTLAGRIADLERYLDAR